MLRKNIRRGCVNKGVVARAAHLKDEYLFAFPFWFTFEACAVAVPMRTKRTAGDKIICFIKII